MISPKPLLHILIHGRSDELPDTRGRIVLRWLRIAVLIVTGLVTLQSVLLVAGAWRNDIAIQRKFACPWIIRTDTAHRVAADR